MGTATSALGEAIRVRSSFNVDWIHCGAFLVGVSEGDEGHIAEDTQGYAYGVGKTPQEALDDWRSSLEGRYEVLRKHSGVLAPYLARELEDIGNKLALQPTYATAAA